MYYVQTLSNLLISRIWFFLSFIDFRLKGIVFGKGLKVSGNYYFLKHPLGKAILGENVRINSGVLLNPFGGENKTIIVVGKNAILNIGNNVGISNTEIHCYEKIIIEDDVYIGGGTTIFDTDFHSLKYSDRMMRPDINVKKKQVLIKKGAFIGGYSIIGKGLTIGERAIIGAGSVVKTDIPNDEIWGGNPASFIRKIG